MTHVLTKPIIGTHNSMTYLRPQHWYGWLMIPFARCQRKTLNEQWDAGARCFDLRIRFTAEGRAYFAHGLYECRYKSISPYSAIYVLAAKAIKAEEDIFIRLILEDPDKRNYCEYYFTEFCDWAKLSIDSRVHFFGGNRKGDWKQVYTFSEKPNLVQMVGSMADDAHWWEKIMPFTYALRKNRKNKKNPSGDITIYDFI